MKHCEEARPYRHTRGRNHIAQHANHTRVPRTHQINCFYFISAISAFLIFLSSLAGPIATETEHYLRCLHNAQRLPPQLWKFLRACRASRGMPGGRFRIHSLKPCYFTWRQVLLSCPVSSDCRGSKVVLIRAR
jgi:hypothetical protein